MNEARALQRSGPGDSAGRGRGMDRFGGWGKAARGETPGALMRSVAAASAAGQSYDSHRGRWP